MVRCQATAFRTDFEYRRSVLELRLALMLTVYLTAESAAESFFLAQTVANQDAQATLEMQPEGWDG